MKEKKVSITNLSLKPASIRYSIFFLALSCLLSVIVLLYNCLVMGAPWFALILSFFEIAFQVVVIVCIQNRINTARILMLITLPIILYYSFFIPSLFSYSIVVALCLLFSYMLRILSVFLVFFKNSNKWFKEEC